MQSCRCHVFSTGHDFTRANRPYAAFGHFGLLYRNPICVSWVLTRDFGFLLFPSALKTGVILDDDAPVPDLMVSAMSLSTGQLFP